VGLVALVYRGIGYCLVLVADVFVFGLPTA